MKRGVFMKQNKLHTPEGVRDLLPEECAVKLEVQKRIETVFHRYGFYTVETPTFEYYEVFANEWGSIQPKYMYKFFDREGSILTLRADMTPPIARMAAATYTQKQMPLRLCYFGNTFRYNEKYQGKLREFTQAGVELIGVNSNDADAEVIALAVNSLLIAGITEFQIDIGQVDFFIGIIEEAGLTDQEGELLQELIDNKDYIGLEEAVEEMDIDGTLKELILDLPKLFGSMEVLQKARAKTENHKAINALEKLQNVYEILCAYGVEKYISFDLGMVTRLNYYTGIIFRGYTYGTGVSIVDGGRYDGLLGEFGQKQPAVGFAIMLNELIGAMERQQIPILSWSVDTLLVFTKNSLKQALSCGDILRSEGMYVENSLLGEDLNLNISYAEEKGIGGIVFFEDQERVKLINTVTRETIETTVNELLKQASKEDEPCGI